MGYNRGIWFIVTVFAAVLFISLSFGQTKKESQKQQVLQEEAAAIVKLIPVRVLDASGRPVKGLKKEDFILYDNKDLKTITEFEVYEMGKLTSPMEEAGGVSQPEGSPQTNRKYFILLDIQGSDEVGMANAKKAAMEFVETKINPGDEVCVCSFTPMTGLIIQQYLTSDLEKIKKGIGRAKEVPPTPGFESGREIEDSESEALGRRGMANRESSGSPFGDEGTRIMGVDGLRIYGRQNADFSASMSELAKVIKYIPGSKNLVYFSSRVPGRAVARLFAEANTPIYAINTKNWMVQGLMTLSVKKKHIYKEHPLKDFAEASGGHYFADIKDVQTIADEIEILSGNYYVLGYYIDEKWDGRFHQIKVEVKKPDLIVLAQDGYYNPKPFAELTDIEKQIHLYDLAFADKPAAPVLDLQIEALCGCMMEETNVVLLTKLEVDERTGIPPGMSEVFIFLFDEDHKMVAAERAELDLSAYDQKTLYSYLMKKLEPGEYECRVVVRDMEMGKSLVGQYSFSAPEPAAGTLAIYSPLLLMPGKKADFLRFSSEKQKKGEKQASLIDFYPFLPQNTSPLMGNIGVDVKNLWAIIPVSFKGQEPSEVEMEVEMIDEATGESLPIDWRIIDSHESESAVDFLLVEIDLPDLESGAYWLEVTATDTNANTLAEISTPVIKR
jgi:VWFA-related protein